MRILIISCSDSKSKDSGNTPAIDRYQGRMYKVVKKARRDGYWPQDIHIFIVSAKYGFISEDTPIDFYDQKMTKARAIELRPVVSSALDALLNATAYSSIFINMGKIYMKSIGFSSALQLARQSSTLQEAKGGIGLRQQQMKAWILEQYHLDQQSLQEFSISSNL